MQQDNVIMENQMTERERLTHWNFSRRETVKTSPVNIVSAISCVRVRDISASSEIRRKKKEKRTSKTIYHRNSSRKLFESYLFVFQILTSCVSSSSPLLGVSSRKKAPRYRNTPHVSYNVTLPFEEMNQNDIFISSFR